VVALHTLRTLVGVGTQPVQELKGMPEAPPTGWVGSRGNLTAVRLERVAVVVGVGSGEEFQGRELEEAVGNTEAPEVAGASWSSAAAGFLQRFQVV